MSKSPFNNTFPPIASTANLGVVKPDGSTITITSQGVISASGGGGGAVDSVFGRTGVVTAQSGDYDIAEITGAGTMASQDADAVDITGGSIFSVSITGSVIDGSPIGNSNPQPGTFTFVQFTPTNGITAAGTDAPSATPLTTQINNVTTVASGTGVVLPNNVNGRSVKIYNNGLNSLKVYANAGTTINGVDGQTGITMAAGTELEFDVIATDTWIYSNPLSGLGTMAYQNANTVAITGGSADNITIGNSTPGIGIFSSLRTLAENSITATGTTRADAYQLTAQANNLSTVASGTGVILPSAKTGAFAKVLNQGANTAKIYANGADTINGIAGSTGISLAAGLEYVFQCMTTGVWVYEVTGTMSLQNANAVAITGGTVDGTPIGGTTAAAGKFTFFTGSADGAVTAAGTTRSDAFQLTAQTNTITTAAASSGVILPNVDVGTTVWVQNRGANQARVYANGSQTLNATAGSTGVILPVNMDVAYHYVATNTWFYQALGTMALQGFSSVSITGGTINGTNTGVTTPALGCFTFYNGSTSNALTATGTTRADALALTSQVNVLTTVASGTGAILPTVSKFGTSVIVINQGVNALKLYADGSEQINNIAGSTGITLQPDGWYEFTYGDTNSWYGVAFDPNTLGTMSLYNVGAVPAVTDGSFGASGDVGYKVTSTVDSGSAVSLSDNTPADITSITLPAGQWRIRANPAYITNSSTTVTSAVAWIATASASTTGRETGNTCKIPRAIISAAVDFSGMIVWDVSHSTTTTYYLVINVDFAGGGAAVTAYGEISGLDVR